MVTIITALVAEHRVFCVEFDRVEEVLLKTRKLEKVKELAGFVETMLLRHAAAEEDLLLLALDHEPAAHEHRSDRCQREHQEIDARLTQVQMARNLAQARRLLQGAMATSRRHFKHEERVVFPLIEKIMTAGRLTKLGAIWKMRNQEPANDGARSRQSPCRAA